MMKSFRVKVKSFFWTVEYEELYPSSTEALEDAIMRFGWHKGLRVSVCTLT